MDISKFLVKIFGDKKSRDLKAYRPFVEAVLQISPEIQALSNDELRDRTQKIRQRIQDSAAELREQIQTLKNKIPGTDILIAIADTLDVSLDYLTGRKECMDI